MILKFTIKINRTFSINSAFLILLMESNPLLAQGLQNLDLDSDSSIASRELVNFDLENFLILFKKNNHKKKRSSSSFNLTNWWAWRSQTKKKNHDEEDKLDQQDPKMKQKGKLFSTLNEMGMSISKMAQLDTLGLSESTIKRKKIKRNWIHQTQAGSGKKKTIDVEKDSLY